MVVNDVPAARARKSERGSMRKILLVAVAAIGVATTPAIATAAPKPDFVYQDKDLAALTASRT